MVAEHGHHRDVEVAHDVGDDLRLLGLAVGGQVAGQQDDVRAVRQTGERGGRKGIPVDDALFARGEVMSVLGMEMRVMALEDVLVTKLMALSEHSLRYESLLAIARALREKVDWEDVRARTHSSPFARAFFVMLEGLGVLPEAKPTTGGHETRVRVLTPRGSSAAHVG